MSGRAGWGAKPSAVSTIIAATSRFRRVKSWLPQRPFPAFVNVSPDNLPVIGECTYGCSKFGHEPDLDAGRQYPAADRDLGPEIEYRCREFLGPDHLGAWIAAVACQCRRRRRRQPQHSGLRPFSPTALDRPRTRAGPA